MLITYDLSSLGGSSYQYDFTIDNSGPDAIADGVEGFTIFFDYTLYDDLALVSSPSDWDSVVLATDVGLMLDGIFDSLALFDPIFLNTSLGGFSMSFTWLGSPNDLVGGDFFEVYTFDDNFDFVSLYTTFTPESSLPRPDVVPTPGIIWLFMLAMAMVLMREKLMLLSCKLA